MFTIALLVGISVLETTHGTTIANLGFEEVVFPTPVFPGDTIHAETEVVASRESKSRSDAGIVTLRAPRLQPARRARVPSAPQRARCRADRPTDDARGRTAPQSPLRTREPARRARQASAQQSRRRGPRPRGRSPRRRQGRRPPTRQPGRRRARSREPRPRRLRARERRAHRVVRRRHRRRVRARARRHRRARRSRTPSRSASIERRAAPAPGSAICTFSPGSRPRSASTRYARSCGLRSRRATSAPKTSSPTWVAFAPSRARGAVRAFTRRVRGAHRGRARRRPGRHRHSATTTPSSPTLRSGARSGTRASSASTPRRSRSPTGRSRRRRRRSTARRRLLAAYDGAVARGEAAIAFEGQMIDEPLARHARAVLAAQRHLTTPTSVDSRRHEQHRSSSSRTSRVVCSRSRSSSPKRGGSRTPSRRPRPSSAASTPSSPAAHCSPTPTLFAEIRAARRRHRCRRRPAPPPPARPAPRRVRAPAGAAGAPARDRRARDAASSPRSTTFRGDDRRPSRRQQHDRRDPPHERRHRRAPRGVGGVEADRARGRGRASESSPGCATRPRATSGSATTSRSRSQPPSSTRIACSPRSPTSTAPPSSRSREWKHELDTSLAARFGSHRRRAPPVAPRRPVLPGRARGGRDRARRPVRRRRPRGAHHPHLRRARPRPATSARSTATSTRATARASTRSASTSTAKATSACSATSSRASAGWTRCSTSSATRSTTARPTRRFRGSLRGAAHSLTTEGIAMLVGPAHPRSRRGSPTSPGVDARDRRRAAAAPCRRTARRAARVRPLGARDDQLRAPALRRPRRRPRHALVGSRGAVPARAPPRRPRTQPDWAAKIHLAAAPVYYQNYLYGELFASQLDGDARPNVPAGSSTAARPASCSCATCSHPGASLRWDDARDPRDR